MVSVFVKGEHGDSEHLLRSAWTQELDGRKFLVGVGTPIGEQKTIESNATVWIAWDSVERIIPWTDELWLKNRDYRR